MERSDGTWTTEMAQGVKVLATEAWQTEVNCRTHIESQCNAIYLSFQHTYVEMGGFRKRNKRDPSQGGRKKSQFPKAVLFHIHSTACTCPHSY